MYSVDVYGANRGCEVYMHMALILMYIPFSIIYPGLLNAAPIRTSSSDDGVFPWEGAGPDVTSWHLRR